MNLDNIKQVWKQQKTENFSREEILKMLQKKSSSVAKWIFYIGLIEFVFWLLLSLSSSDNEKIIDNTTLSIIDYFSLVNYPICILFITLFFFNYKKIGAHQTIKELLQNIFRMRKTLQAYIIYNISMLSIALSVSVFSLISHNDKLLQIPSNTEHPILFTLGFLVGIILFIGLFCTILYFFYKLLYGFLLKRLSENYNEIKELENN